MSTLTMFSLEGEYVISRFPFFVSFFPEVLTASNSGSPVLDINLEKTHLKVVTMLFLKDFPLLTLVQNYYLLTSYHLTGHSD